MKTCYFIGNTQIALSCLQFLSESNEQFSIEGVVSQDDDIVSWAKTNQIPCYELEALEKAVDYIFSIINYQILTKEIRQLAKILAINCHTSLLPELAGMHPTSFGIFLGNSIHGVTFHEIDDGIDTGKILLQEKVSIEEEETTASLNRKCAEKAIDMFKCLVDQLISGKYTLEKQDIKKRSLIKYAEKLPGNGLINWNSDANEIFRIFRALSFENQSNPLGMNKCFIGEQLLIPISMQIVNQKYDEPGILLEINNEQNYLVVSTKTQNIRLKGFIRYSDGEPIDVSTLIKNREIRIKTPICKKEKASMHELLKIEAEKFFKDELYWEKELKKSIVLNIPFYSSLNNLPDQREKQKFSIKWDAQSTFKKFLTYTLIYLYRINDYQNFSFYLETESSKKIIREEVQEFYEDCVIFNTNFNANEKIEDSIRSVETQLSTLSKKTPRLKDFGFRYPDLKDIINLIQLKIVNISSLEKYLPKNDTKIEITFDESSGKLSIYLNEVNCNNENLKFFFKKLFFSIQTLINIDKNITLKNFPSTIEEKPTLKPLPEPNKKDSGKTLNQLFEITARKYPKKTAAIENQKKYTYGFIDQESNKVANFLKTQKITIGSIVAIHAERSAKTIIWILGILKIGAAYLPIATDEAFERITFITKESAFDLILTDSNSFYDFENTINISTTNLNFFSGNFNSVNNPKNLAYIMYTSGSTGTPKGVMVQHDSLIACIDSYNNLLKINGKDTFLAITSLTFDVSLLDYFAPWEVGGKVVISSEEQQKDIQSLLPLIAEYATVMQATPTVWSLLIQCGWKGKKGFKISTAGEELTKDLARKLFDCGKLFNLYGPTETGIYATATEITQENIETFGIGNPMNHVNTLIIDRYNHPAFFGMIGKLFVGGKGVARGYLNQDKLTQTKFLKLDGIAGRFYDSGDLVNQNLIGFEYHGRNDTEIKYRGKRINLKEISKHFEVFQFIKDSFVTTRKTTEGKVERIVIYLFSKENLNYAEEIIKIENYLRNHLPPHMIPEIHFVKKIPLLKSGKVDVKSLPDYSISLSQETQNHETELSKQLSNIFFEILGGNREEILKKTFIQLGGNSILSMQVTRKIRSLGYPFKTQELNEFNTIKKLEQYLTKKDNRKNSEQVLKIGFYKNFNLSPIQVWFFEQKFENIHLWNQTCLLSFEEDTDISLVKSSIEKAMRHHLSFKIKFTNESGNWEQHYSEQDPSIVWKDAKEEKFSSLEEIHSSIEKDYCFINIETGEIAQAILVTMNGNPILALSIHHLFIDGVSWRIFLETVQEFYGNSNAVIKQSGTVDYQKWVADLEDAQIQLNLAVNSSEWLEKLIENSKKIQELPMLFPNRKEKNKQIISKIFNNQFLKSHFKQKPDDLELAVDDIMLALFIHSIYSWTKHQWIYFNLERHGRETLLDKDLSACIGWFTSLFPCAIQFFESERLEEYILYIAQKLTEIPQGGIGYGVLRYLNTELKETKKLLTELPTPQIGFNYWGEIEIYEKKSIMKIEDIALSDGLVNHPMHLIELNIAQINNIIQFKWVFDEQKISAEVMKGIADHFNTLYEKFLLIDWSHYAQKKLTHKNINPFPLSHLQKGLLYESMKNSQYYITQVPVKLKDIFLEKMRLAWEALLKRHEVLRTRVETDNKQVTETEVILPWQEDYVSSDAEFSRKIDQILKDDRKKSYNFLEAPLFRIYWVIFKNNYCMIFSHHHIILDGPSIEILLKELKQYYNEIKNGKDVNFPPAPSFKHFIRKQLTKAEIDFSKNQKFWNNYLDDYEGPQTFRFKIESTKNNYDKRDDLYPSELLLFPENFSADIKKYLQLKNLTVNQFFVGLWGFLLSKYTCQQDVIFGVTVSLRDHTLSDESLAGLCINTLPIRIKISDDTQIDTFFSQIESDMHNVIEHSQVDLTSLLNNKGISLESLLVCANYTKQENRVREKFELKLDQKELRDITGLPLVILVTFDKQLRIKVTFNDTINRKTAKKILSHFENTIKHIMQVNTLSDIEISPEEESEKIKKFSQGKKSTYEKKPAHEYVEEQARKTPKSIAVTYQNKNFTYEELNNHANQLAKHLKKINKQPKYIALFFPQSLNTVISILATLKLGAAYIPIDTQYPIERIRIILQKSNADLLLIDPFFTKHDFKKIFPIEKTISVTEETYNSQSIDNLKASISIESAAYVIFTSGTTGMPKGVELPHKLIVNLIQWQKKQTNNNQNKKVALFSSAGFDQSVQEIFFTLFLGHQLFIVPEDIRLDMREYLMFLQEHTINQTFLPTDLLTYFAQTALEHKIKLPHLRRIIVAGSGLKLNEIIKEFLEKHPEVNLWDLFGPSETHVCSTYCYPHSPKKWHSTSIGKPIDNVTFKVLNLSNQPVPIGMAGQLFVSGDCLAIGYINDDSNSKKFISIDGARYYATGDLVRWTEDGNLIYLGRLDDQIKINGHRIELKEIEMTIIKIEDVQQASILAIKNKLGYTLVGFYTSKKAETSVKSIQNFLSKTLSRYMIPEKFIPLEHFPLTAHGKVDKKQLEKIYLSHKDTEEYTEETYKIVNPENEIEKEIHDLWKMVFKDKMFGIHHSFASLGGSSLDILQIIFSLRNKGFNSISVADFLDGNITIADLAKKIVNQSAENDMMANDIILLNEKRPLFLIHPIGGTVFWYKEIGKQIDGREVYGIQDPAIKNQGKTYGTDFDFKSIGEIVAYYKREIKEKQPEGPYYIGGASSGGIIAVELARELDTKAVILLDSWAEHPDFINDETKFKSVMKNQLVSQNRERNIREDAFDWLIELQWKRIALFRDYKMLPIPNHLNLLLFKAEELLPAYEMKDHSHNHWNTLSQNLTVTQVPGNHETMFAGNNAKKLAEELNISLLKIDNDKQKETVFGFPLEMSAANLLNILLILMLIFNNLNSNNSLLRNIGMFSEANHECESTIEEICESAVVNTQ